VTTFNPALYGLAVCSTPLNRDGSGVVLPCGRLDKDAADWAENLEVRRRRQIIMDGVSEWRRLGPGMLKQNPRWTWRSWTNASLTQAGLPPLTAAEVREYDS
jgi:hypothetical protein